MRLFAAIFPTPDALARIEEVAQRVRKEIPTKGAWVKPDRMHLTVHFFGDRFPEATCRVMLDEATRGVGGFELVLRTLGGFPNSRLKRVLFLEPEPRSELSQVMKYFATPDEPNDRPHLTLARFNQPVEVPRITFEPISWKVDGIALVNSVQFGSEHRYSILREWKLDGQTGDG